MSRRLNKTSSDLMLSGSAVVSSSKKVNFLSQSQSKLVFDTNKRSNLHNKDEVQSLPRATQIPIRGSTQTVIKNRLSSTQTRPKSSLSKITSSKSDRNSLPKKETKVTTSKIYSPDSKTNNTAKQYQKNSYSKTYNFDEDLNTIDKKYGLEYLVKKKVKKGKIKKYDQNKEKEDGLIDSLNNSIEEIQIPDLKNNTNDFHSKVINLNTYELNGDLKDNLTNDYTTDNDKQNLSVDTKINEVTRYRDLTPNPYRDYVVDSNDDTKTEAAKKIQRWYRKNKEKPNHKTVITYNDDFHDHDSHIKHMNRNLNIFASHEKSSFSFTHESDITIADINKEEDGYYNSFINEKFIDPRRFSDQKVDKKEKGTKLSTKPSKHSWLDDLENDVLGSVAGKKESEVAGLTMREKMYSKYNEGLDNNTDKHKYLENSYLSQDKYEHVMNYLQGMNEVDQLQDHLSKQSQSTKQRQKTAAQVRKEQSASQMLNEEVGSGDWRREEGSSKGVDGGKGGGGDDDEKKKLVQEKKELEDKVSKHLAFIDQLIEDKKELTTKLEKFQDQCNSMTHHYQNELKTREERHVIELKKLRDINLAAEQLKREQWVKAEANKIKELTVKGFEPTLQKLIVQNKKEVMQLKNLQKEEIEALERREKKKYEMRVEEMRRVNEEEVERVRNMEQENAKKEYEIQLGNEKEALEAERARLWGEVDKERGEVERMMGRQEEEAKKAQHNLEQVHEVAVNVLKREFESARRQQHHRHAEEVEKMRFQHAEEQQNWEMRFFKRQENALMEKEKSMRERLKKERDREIEKVLMKLEYEREEELEKQKQYAEDQIRKLKVKHKNEFNQIEKSENMMSEKVSKLKAHIFKNETIKENLKAKLTQNKAEIEELTKKLDERNKERSNMVDIVRQEVADKMAFFEAENLKFKQNICDLKAKHKVELKEIKDLTETQLQVKDQEVEEIQSRVKEILAKKNKVEEEIRKEKAAAIKRADYIQEQLLTLKSQPKKKKPANS